MIINEIRNICAKANSWVSKYSLLFYKNKKSYIEYLEANLFLNSSQSNQIARNIIKIYNPIEQQPDIYYRQLEKNALELLAEYDNACSKLAISDEKYFLKLILMGEVPLDILSNREVLYSLTHEIFYSSLFGREKITIYLQDVNIMYLVAIFEQSLLISMRHQDIDVLMELLCSIFILELYDEINQDVFLISLNFMKLYVNEEGYVGFVDSSSDKELFDQVYHTTLVSQILFYILENKNDRVGK